MATIKKAQNGAKTADSTAYFDKKSTKDVSNALKTLKEKGSSSKEYDKAYDTQMQSLKSLRRQSKKGKPGYDANGEKKMKNGGSLTGLKASNKRVGPVDPKGAYTKVQKKTLAGAKGKASLTKDKQLGATKMAKCGTKMSKK